MTSMIKKYSLFLLIGGFIASCSGDGESADTNEESEEMQKPTANYDTLLAEVQELEAEINSMMNPDDELLKKGISKFQEFAGFFPEDSLAPDYLLKASDFAYHTKQYEKSVKILNRIINDYPDYNKMEDVLFNKASHLDFELRDTVLAKQTYQEFIEKYPESELVDDAEARIKYISYSAEELIELFEKNLENQPQ